MGDWRLECRQHGSTGMSLVFLLLSLTTHPLKQQYGKYKEVRCRKMKEIKETPKANKTSEPTPASAHIQKQEREAEDV